MAAHRRLAALAVAVVLGTACSGGSGHPASPQPTSARPAPGVTPLDMTALGFDPGRYENTGFVPHLSFEIRRPGWSPQQNVTGLFDIERNAGSLDVIALQFARPDASSTRKQLAAIRATAGLDVGKPRPVRLGGRHAIKVLVANADPHLSAQRFTPVLSIGNRALSVASGRRLEIYLIQTSDGLLAVMLGGSARHWSKAVHAAKPILASLRFER